MEDFHSWAAKELSENGKVYELETVSTISSLLEKYGPTS